jgi:hypothetical protein
MSEWKELAGWMYGDVRADRGFWYAHPLHEVEGLDEADLFWVPDENCLCMLWHVGHIAHRERLHIGRFLQGLGEDIFPAGYEIFGDRWCSVDEVRGSIDSVQNVLSWVEEVRQQSTEYVESLNEEDWHKVPPTAEFDLSTAHWLFLTISHGAIHIGRIQMLRAMLEGRHDNPC